MLTEHEEKKTGNLKCIILTLTGSSQYHAYNEYTIIPFVYTDHE